METLHLASQVTDCGRDFRSLGEALKQVPRFAAQVSPEKINDEFDRFKIWAGNVAAHRKGRRSLEYRLRDAVHLKNEAGELLTALQESLNNTLSIVTGEKVPWDEMSDSDTDSGTEAGSPEPDTRALEDETELKQLFSGIRDTISCLFRLSMAIRNPAPNTQSGSTITADKSYYEDYDIEHVRAKFHEEKFHNCDKVLMERLGRAISARRQYLSYREEHYKKLAKGVEKIGFEEARTEQTANSTEASPMPKLLGTPTDDNRLVEDKLVDDGEDDLSQSSRATSTNATIRVPSLPKESLENEHYECPLCFMIVSIHTRPAWKEHVYRDLHPYACTFKHCNTADRLYDSRRAWFKHEMEAHRAVWQCIEGCEKAFPSENDFVQHAQRAHPEVASQEAIAILKKTSIRSAYGTDKASCPICDQSMSLRALQKHLGRHQEQLALFALPVNEDDAEDEDDGPNSTEEPEQQESGDQRFERTSSSSEDEDVDIPAVRDHTTDRFKTIGYEYIPREFDEAGEKKVTVTGYLLDGREYKCRTFFTLNRGDKLFMLATECARVLGYSHSDFLFKENRSLYKIIATQVDKDDLIRQEILPYSYRSRQIALVTARSMFRQFGSRLVLNGRPVRDDYWESKARKQESAADGAPLSPVSPDSGPTDPNLPKVPSGWMSQWDNLYPEHYYSQFASGASQWTIPTFVAPTARPALRPLAHRPSVGLEPSEGQTERDQSKNNRSNGDETSVEKTIESRVARIKARVAGLTGDAKVEQEDFDTVLAADNGKFRWPHLPEAGRDGKEFACPYCSMIIRVDSQSWKKHVYSDLGPYIATGNAEKQAADEVTESTKTVHKGADTKSTTESEQTAVPTAADNSRVTDKLQHLFEPSPRDTGDFDDGVNKSAPASTVASDLLEHITEQVRGQLLNDSKGKGAEDGAIRTQEADDDWEFSTTTKKDKKGKKGASEVVHEPLVEVSPPAEPIPAARDNSESFAKGDEDKGKKRRHELEDAVSKALKIHPTYTKIHKDHLSMDTLLYYEIPWEYDKHDHDYFVILRELDERDTDVLFEHTRRLRSRDTSRLLPIEERTRHGNPEYAWVRHKERQPSRSPGRRLSLPTRAVGIGSMPEKKK
ncbi:hypothetical protein BU16DRAFT_565175 [Lophium mytilinum]|uniref:WW domain-containing protein n=1 Tax=Lophium mytilinum TaxID=390894 RepID=A0A6A6QHG6_9PEZI|nr:hypothetical protein BU16DRAFT_565175 [Lophium mytilinum]